MKITALAALTDNYIWLVHQEDKVIAIDPGEAEPLLTYLATHQLQLAAILLTHAHEDHTGGVSQLSRAYPEVAIYGPDETQAYHTHTLADGDTFDLLGLDFQVALTAGHTAGHISYLTGHHLFCGDALFLAGCGRVFTGDYPAQYKALQFFKQLDDDVQVYAGHEYSQTNLRFALSLFPDNPTIQKTLAEVQTKLAKGLPSLPSTIGQERQINPFMQADDLATFRDYRDLRDHF